MSLEVAEFSGYAQRPLYHEMKLHLVHMDVLAGKGADGASTSAYRQLRQVTSRIQGTRRRPVGSSLARGTDLRRARLALCAYT